MAKIEENNINLDEASLLRYLHGSVSDIESELIGQWLLVSPDNRKVLEQISVVDHAGEAVLCMKGAAPWPSLAQVKKKIRRNKQHRIYGWIQRVAASLFIPLVCLTSYYALRTQDTAIMPQYIEMNTAPGLVTSIILPDSSKVWLNANSYIRYPTYFIGNTRTVEISGEAYFVVKKNSSKPFLVNVANELMIQVTGTEFNIEAYPGTSQYSTTLVEGSVQVSATDRQAVVLAAGEQSVWDMHTKSLAVQIVNPLELTSWKDGKIIFRNSSMKEITEVLEKRYNAEFVISPKLGAHHFTGTFTNQQLVQILEHFKISSKIQYEIKGLRLNEDGTIDKTIVHLK